MSPQTDSPTPTPPSQEAIPPVRITQEADGNLRLKVTLPPGARVKLSVDVSAPDGELLSSEMLALENATPVPMPEPPVSAPEQTAEPVQPPQRVFPRFHFSPGKWFSGIRASFQPGWHFWLFAAAVIVYLVVRLVGLEKFPIYFFTDEAIQTVWASDFISHGFKGERNEFLPTFFPNGGQYNLSVSVYLQVLPHLLFGNSVFVNRAASVLVTVIAALAVGLAAKNVFSSRYSWISVLLLSVTPIWFLHSRTSFETALATAFFGGTIYYYLMYRNKSPRFIYGAVIMGTLCFYAYSPAQPVVALSVILLLFSDLKYHWQNRKYILRGAALGLVLLIPYFRFLILHGRENTRHLEIVGSYLVRNLPPVEKLGIYFKEYIKSLDPLYWFLPHEHDIIRHIMKGYGHLLKWCMPFAAIGLFQVFKNIAKSPYRTLLIALLVVPSGAALVGRNPTRLLFIVIPAVLIISIGIEAVLNLLEKWRLPRLALTAGMFALLLFGNIFMLRDALVNGPTWFYEYDMGGLQYGARQLSGEIKDILNDDPSTTIILSPGWANGTDMVMRFFLGDPLPIKFDSVDAFTFEHRDIAANTIFIFPPAEYKTVIESPKFQDVQVEKILPYPDGKPGFYFLRLRYSDRIDEILAEEAEARRVLATETLPLPDKSVVEVSYPVLDMGEIKNILDDEKTSLIRTMEANPLVLKFRFEQPQTMKGVDVLVGSAATRYTARIWTEGESDPRIFQTEEQPGNDNRVMHADFGRDLQVVYIELEIFSFHDKEPAHVHLWEVMFNR